MIPHSKHFVMQLVTLCLVITANAGASAADQPNILLIVPVDNGLELGCYGEPYVATPVWDRLAHEGVRFDKAWPAAPEASTSKLP
ncbi:hypothetical protein [Allorhodopirellula solitaria]|uniref:Uncharacterized protein n=1 Tax=Allorhodopirellula solitaria TaxID=2527987 RepID=A0A5C5XRX1_9BACT|nr:hypothetical protein [Allorhodopirellula solitaria]TWT65271.1 hypothetical protein CA85_31830 [Allorhodopirellula solitaria]